MKTSNVLIIGGLAYGAWYLSQLGVATATVRVVFSGVQIRGITDYLITMTIQNVSNVVVNVNSMSGDILLNGNHFASMGAFDRIQVAPNSQANIDVNVSPDLLSLPGTIRQLIQNGLGTLNFKVVGDVNVNGLVLPFNLDKSVSFN